MRIFVAIPSMDWVHAFLVHWAVGFPAQVPEGHSVSLNFINNVQPVELARNSIAKSFLESGADALLFVDSDVVPGNNVWELFKVKGDIVGGRCQFIDRNKGVFINALRLDRDEFMVDAPKKPVEVKGVGMSLTLIYKRVFDALDYPYFEFLRDKDGKWIMGEDVNFCGKARAKGLKVMFHPDVKGAHYKLFDIGKLPPQKI
jgi:GT2 family glycosyltransferase